MKLSKGILLEILNGIIPERPVLFQVLSTQKLESANTPGHRYRLQLSDGNYFYSNVLLAPRLNGLISNITNNSVIAVPKLVFHKSPDDKRVIVLVELSVLVKGEDVGGRTGTPVPLDPNKVPPLPARPNSSDEAAGKTSVKMENLGLEENADYFMTKGTVVFAKKENCMYKACPTAECNMKVVDRGNGLYHCEKCNKEFPNYKWRMILNFDVADTTDNQWMICFKESAEVKLTSKQINWDTPAI